MKQSMDPNNRTQSPDEEQHGAVVVLGSNILQKPLLESTDAKTIIIHSTKGEAVAFLTRLAGDTWCFAHKSDPDWSSAKLRFGVS